HEASPISLRQCSFYHISRPGTLAGPLFKLGRTRVSGPPSTVRPTEYCPAHRVLSGPPNTVRPSEYSPAQRMRPANLTLPKIYSMLAQTELRRLPVPGTIPA